MRHFWTAALCLLIFENLPAQRPAWLATAFAKDSARAARLNDEHKRLPKGLARQVGIVDSVLNDICRKNKIEPPEHCDKVRHKLEAMRDELYRIESEIGPANLKLDSVELAFENLKAHVQSCPTLSPKDYRAYKNRFLNPQVAGYTRLFASIKRRQNRIAFKALFYGVRNFWSKEPLVTTFISNYLEQERRQHIKEAKQQINELEAQIKDSEQQKGRLGKALGESEIALLRKQDSLDSVRTSLHNAQKQQASSFSELEKMEKKKADFENQISALMGRIDSIKVQLSRKTKELSSKTRQLSSENTRLQIENDSLKSERDSLQSEKEELRQAVDAGGLSKDYERWLWASATLFLLLALCVEYQRRRNKRRGIQKARLTNAKLAATNEQLKDKKAKLEALIGELHHRTKNNLQEISSLLYLQARERDDDNLRNALNEARGRIDAIGIVHRLLYQDKQQKLTAVNIADYIEELVGHLFKFYHLSRESVRTDFRLQKVYIETDKAIQIGLITNELVHNCFKHAFPKNEHPELVISLEVEVGGLYLTVRDNGPGLPPGTKLGEINSFGLKLVRQLVEGRRGMLQYDQTNGTAFKVTLPLDADEYEVAT